GHRMLRYASTPAAASTGTSCPAARYMSSWIRRAFHRAASSAWSLAVEHVARHGLRPPADHPGRPQRPHPQQRLEEQADQALGVGVEAERVGALDVLGDVPGEDGDEEPGDDQTDRVTPAAQQDQRQPEDDLDDA